MFVMKLVRLLTRSQGTHPINVSSELFFSLTAASKVVRYAFLKITLANKYFVYYFSMVCISITYRQFIVYIFMLLEDDFCKEPVFCWLYHCWLETTWHLNTLKRLYNDKDIAFCFKYFTNIIKTFPFFYHSVFLPNNNEVDPKI